ncbi:MAG: hybrid sensor histidine kinase/response regulator [Deltaproteobacteria bacterium]|nr:hybrid sensor histidine kinase/response regulator [Deltaproteobacteria bacterium]
MVELASEAYRVVGVDDDPAILDLLRRVVESEGSVFYGALDGERGLELVRTHLPDAVVLDVMMPGIDGFEVCRRIKEDERLRIVPVLILTAMGSREHRVTAIQAGCDDFIPKPFSPTELKARIRSVARSKRLNELVRAQRDQLVRAQRAREELSAFLVHDLKTPLASIVLNSHIIAEEPLSEPGRKSLADIQRATETMERMVMNLLDVSQSDDGALKPRKVAIDVPKMFEEARRFVERSASHLAMDVRIEGAIELMADRDLLVRVLRNLLDNAARYSPQRGRIHLSATRVGSEVELCVGDEGPGIPEPDREKLFEKYGRLSGARPSRDSRGLGLVFCRRAIEAHGGRIAIDPTTTKGATFRIRLPCV